MSAEELAKFLLNLGRDQRMSEETRQNLQLAAEVIRAQQRTIQELQTQVQKI